MKWLSKKSLLICLTLLMLVVVVVSMIVTTGMPVREDAVNMVLDDWTTEQVIDPPDEPYYSGEKTVYQLVMSHKVTSEMRGKVISFRTNDSYVDAYLTDVAGTPEDDAVHIYHFGERLKICDSPGTYTHFIRLPESAVGQVTICVETVYANKFMPSYEVAIGTQNELLFNYLRQNLLSGIFNAAMLIAGVLLLVIYTVGRTKHVSAPETLSLGCLSIVFAVNLNCPLFLNQFLYQNAVVQYYVNYFSLFLLPLLAMLYFEDIVPDLRIRWPFYSFLVLECVLSVLHFTGIASYTRTVKVFSAALGNSCCDVYCDDRKAIPANGEDQPHQFTSPACLCVQQCSVLHFRFHRRRPDVHCPDRLPAVSGTFRGERTAETDGGDESGTGNQAAPDTGVYGQPDQAGEPLCSGTRCKKVRAGTYQYCVHGSEPAENGE